MPRRVLLRMKKLRRFLDERIREARASLGAPADQADASGAEARIEAFQEVREAMVGDRLARDEGGPRPEAGDAARGEASAEASREAG